MLRRSILPRRFFCSSSTCILFQRKEVVAIFKPSSVPLYSPLQALHDTFDIKNDKNDALTNRILRQEKNGMDEKNHETEEGQKIDGHNLNDENEEIIRFDRDSSSPSKKKTANANKNKTNIPSSAGEDEDVKTSQSQEVRFPLQTSDWFSSGVTLAARTPSSFAFLLHAACIGAIRREYHALCRVPRKFAKALYAQQRQDEKASRKNEPSPFLQDRNNANSTLQLHQEDEDSTTHSSSLSSVESQLNNRNNDSEAFMNPHLRKHENKLKNSSSSSSTGVVASNLLNSLDADLLQNSENESKLLLLSRSIATSGLFRWKNNRNASSPPSVEILPSGWVKGATAKLSDLVTSKSYRPDIDELFLPSSSSSSSSSKMNASRTATSGSNSNNYHHQHYWTGKRPHPFVRQSDILSPARQSHLQTLGSCSQVDLQFVVEDDGVIFFPLRTSSQTSSTTKYQHEDEEAIIHLKLNVYGLQSEASIRCALAAAGFPVVNDFEYDLETANPLHEMFSRYAESNPHQHYFPIAPKNKHVKEIRKNLRPLAVDYNRMLTPTEMMIRQQIVQEEEGNSYTRKNLAYRKFEDDDKQGDHHQGEQEQETDSTLFGPDSTNSFAPKLFCSKIVYPSPDSHRNIGVLRHMLGPTTTTRDLVTKATKKVPTQDTTANFICEIAQVDNLPFEYNLKDRIFNSSRNKKKLSSSSSSEISISKSTGVGVVTGDENIISSQKTKGKNNDKDEPFSYSPSLPADSVNNSNIKNYQEENNANISEAYRRKRDSNLLSYMDDVVAVRSHQENSKNRFMLDRQVSSTFSGTTTMNSNNNNNHNNNNITMSDEDLGARQILLDQIRAASEAQEMNTYKGGGLIHNKNSQVNISTNTVPAGSSGKPPGIHFAASPTASSGNMNRTNSSGVRQQRCRFCFGPHPVAVCPKLKGTKK